MNFIICSNRTSRNKPCKHCKKFLFWGILMGYCGRFHKDKNANDHCKYFKRESRYWTKDGKCKISENQLYS